jgi:hypothetical protein
MDSIGRHITDQLGSLFQSESMGLVRLFEVEYHKDYRHALKSGATVTDDYVRMFLKSRDQFV